ncbi:unnamed protein product [Zymoseptoria tritici ST99CH_1A5]|uniref:CBM1 domain-containing protein n=1 Tax=Zymoseptoria tritici ST99CH_1A5 TaxID=1276529 RepID=A0A1Y6LI86_ZYMTR|nr:unnamed protein product [Zymoseptoria tritici ST99CH_1A5]
MQHLLHLSAMLLMTSSAIAVLFCEVADKGDPDHGIGPNYPNGWCWTGEDEHGNPTPKTSCGDWGPCNDAGHWCTIDGENDEAKCD